MSIYSDGTERIEWGTCAICGVPIMHEGEWDARHSDDLDDMHDDCCNNFGPCSKSQPMLGWSKDRRDDDGQVKPPWYMPTGIIVWAS